MTTPGGTTAAYPRRLAAGYFERIFVGRGIDIGCGEDPVTPDCDRCDQALGHDAESLPHVPDAAYDWVYSSHCLEHLRHPLRALKEWWRILRPGGWLIVVVPDEDLYEQGLWPSRFNVDHKWTFAIGKTMSWSSMSLNLDDLVRMLPGAQVQWLERFCDNYDHSGGVWDRTLLGQEAHVEAVVLKGIL